ncbi:MAG: PAS domain-containing protein [Acidobacteria bacterium]|nr:PAS domain-containing protein [Acidobacteriota bacterium]
MIEGPQRLSNTTGGATSPPVVSPSQATLRWFVGLRLIVISTLFLGILLIQATSPQILPLKHFYGIILTTYALSLGYLFLHLIGLSHRMQAIIQLVGDIGIVTGLVYFTGGFHSPFSFLYLAVIVAGAVIIRGGGLIFAGLSAIAYGLLVDLMVFDLLPIPPNLTGIQVSPSLPRILAQLLINVVGFALVAILVSYLSESLRSARSRLTEEIERAQRLAAVTDHVVRSVAAGIVATDLEGRVLHLNPAGRRILGLAPEARAEGLDLDEVMPLADHAWGLLYTRARSLSSIRIEDNHRTSGLRLGLTLGPLKDEAHKLAGFIISFQDLSEIEGAAARQRMQERMAAVGEMAARMAHEIKNPLAGISGSAQMLASMEGTDHKTSRLLHILVDESGRLSTILDNFLDYSRPSHGSHQQCDLTLLLRDCVDLLRRSDLPGPDHHIDLDFPESLLLLGEEPLLRQMVWNLARNALEAMPEGGTLKISANKRPGTVLLAFSDTGIGMSEDIRKHAFEPFVTSTPGGTGLGLAVVYNVVEQHNGTIEIDSTPGTGTTIRIEMPCLRPGETA